MVLDTDVLREVTELCQQADYWDDEWQDAASKVRHTIAGYMASLPGWRASHYGQESLASPPEPNPTLGQVREADKAADARMDAFSMLGCLEAWLAEGRTLAGFLELWEAPEGED
jgi:hypothetical protein